MSKKFNLDDYKGKYVMYCDTPIEIKNFCKFLEHHGRLLTSKVPYEKTILCTSVNSAYIYFNEGLWSRTINTDQTRYTILHWSDFMDKEITKADLRNGDVVLRRNGDVEILMSGVLNGRFIDKYNGQGEMTSLSDDLTVEAVSARDIIAVRRPNDISDMSFDAFEKKLGRLVYERDETVEMTLEEVCKALGKNVKIVKEAK